MKIFFSVFIGALLTIVAMPASANLASSLSDGQHVLLMRHADAPGYGDPKGYQLDQCASQRNLGEAGKKQSQIIGKWLKSQGISNARIFSSPWCRCLDTAKLLDFGPVITAPELGSFFDDMSLEKQQTKNLENLIQAQLNENQKVPTIMVTHHVNIQAFTGKVVNVGDMVLVKVDKNGKYRSHELYPSPGY